MSALVAALELTSQALNEATHKLDAMAWEVSQSEAERKKLEIRLDGALNALDTMICYAQGGDLPPASVLECTRKALVKFGSV